MQPSSAASAARTGSPATVRGCGTMTMAAAGPMASNASSPSPPGSSSLEEAVEPPDVFCNLGSLIVEGRMPRPGAARGCGEGPHVPMPNIHGAAGQRHECSLGNYLVSLEGRSWFNGGWVYSGVAVKYLFHSYTMAIACLGG